MAKIVTGLANMVDDTTGQFVGVIGRDGKESRLAQVSSIYKGPATIVISDSAPDNGDGMPDGTIYIQTAP